MKFINLSPLEPRKNYRLDSLKEVTILIKTLEREAHLTQLLFSIKKYGFKGPIIIADDSLIPYGSRIKSTFKDLNILYLELPFDTGTAEGRNIMLEKVQTPFFLLLDDDFVLDRRSRIPLMKKLLLNYELDILGGVFLQHNKKSRKGKYLIKVNHQIKKIGWILPSYDFYEYHAGLEIGLKTVSVYPISYKSPVTLCDLTHNFFLAKTEKIKAFGGWNPILKGGEHQNFFIRAKLAGLKVGTTRECGVIHDQWTPNSEAYKSLRQRGHEFQMLALEEFGLQSLENYSKVFRGKFGL